MDKHENKCYTQGFIVGVTSLLLAIEDKYHYDEEFTITRHELVRMADTLRDKAKGQIEED